MKRTEFIRSLGLGSGALMGVYCMGTLTSCAKEDTPLPPISNNPPVINPITGKVDFALDLSEPINKALITEGGYLYNDYIIIARAKSGNYVALSKVCTHEGNVVIYQKDSDNIYCPVHGSTFSLTGKVIKNPALSELKQYLVEYNSATLKLRIFES
jgi:cytochrome b6-f complex iron-sulfur subunit